MTYVGFSENKDPIYLHDRPDGDAVRQVLWGDYLQVEGPASGDPNWLEVTWAPDSDSPETLFIREGSTTSNRPLEVIFVDVGQGDGAVLITPEDDGGERVVVIDAGEGSNMSDFLIGRFGSYQTSRQFHAAVITHADIDHYRGFKPIFSATADMDPHNDAADGSQHLVGFDHVYHPGLLEGPDGSGYDRLGGRESIDGRGYLTGLVRSDDDVKERFGHVEKGTKKPFSALIRAALDNPNIGEFTMLSDSDGEVVDGVTYMPGFTPQLNRGYSIEVVGPLLERPENKPALRTISNYSKTKNGHSVLLKLRVGDFQILFGGDLNKEAERFILQETASLPSFPDPDDEPAAYEAMIQTAAQRFGADVMKVCHHGSEKVTNEFLQAVNPAVFVISSGDREGHVHPRPDLLGRLGKFGRGESPVLLSTELQRSTRPEEDPKLVARIHRNIDRLAEQSADPLSATAASLKADVTSLSRTNVDVYGSIYLKTDGDRMIAAFKKESGSSTDKWFHFHYRMNDGGVVLVDP